MKFPNVFLHIHTNNLNVRNITFYKINELYDEAFDGIIIEEKLFYSINENKFKELMTKNEPYFLAVDYEVQQSPIFEYFIQKHKNCFLTEVSNVESNSENPEVFKEVLRNYILANNQIISDKNPSVKKITNYHSNYNKVIRSIDGKIQKLRENEKILSNS